MASANSSAKTEAKNDSKDVDQNNNIEKSNNNDHNKVNKEKTQKLKYELPLDYKYEVHNCICDRPQMVYECGRCHHYFHGRISMTCKVHPRDCFLMDFCTCPYCFTSATNVMESSLSLEQVRHIEEAQLPDDGDDF